MQSNFRVKSNLGYVKLSCGFGNKTVFEVSNFIVTLLFISIVSFIIISSVVQLGSKLNTKLGFNTTTTTTHPPGTFRPLLGIVGS